MRLLTLAAAVILAGCASGGGAPTLGDPDEEVRSAQRMIQSAQEAGADSLAILSMSEARAALTAAQDKTNTREYTAMKAREATASAAYARAVAGRLRAERARNDAKAALDALPPEGAR